MSSIYSISAKGDRLCPSRVPGSRGPPGLRRAIIGGSMKPTGGGSPPSAILPFNSPYYQANRALIERIDR